jgi:hypothetical protein
MRYLLCKTYVLWGVPVLIFVISHTGVAQSRLPDLVISNAKIEKTGELAERLIVTVLNRCGGAAGPTYLLATFKQNAEPNSKPIYFVGHAIKALRGGESTINIFDLKGKNITPGTFVLIEVDPYKNVKESNKDNNTMTLNPNSAFPSTKCGN